MAKILAIYASPDGSVLEIPLGPLANLPVFGDDEELLEAVKTLEWAALSSAQEPSNWNPRPEVPSGKKGNSSLFGRDKKSDVPWDESWRALRMVIRNS